MHVHHHPVIQKVMIGLFVWGMMLFSYRVATAQEKPKNVVFPVDLPAVYHPEPYEPMVIESTSAIEALQNP